MGLNLEAFEAFKKQASSSSGGNGSGGGSSVSNSSAGSSKSSGVGSSQQNGKSVTSPYKKDNADGPNSGSIFSIEDEGYAASNAKDAINHLLESSLFQNCGIKDAASRIDKDLINNEEWTVDLDVDGDGTIDQGVKLADAIAASYDSELDLYIEDQLQQLMKNYQCYDLKSLFGSENAQALKDLAALGIRADAVGDDENWQNRTYSFSLVKLPDNFDSMTPEEKLAYVNSPDAEILTDGNGKKGSIVFSDCLIPDGIAQGAELNLSSILDTMGYDCISKADFIGKEDEYFTLMEQISEDLINGKYGSDGTTFTDIYSENTMGIWRALRARDSVNANAPGQWAWKKFTFAEHEAMIEKLGLGSEGGRIRKTGVPGGDNSPMTDGEYKAGLEETAAEKEQKEASKVQAKYDEILKDKKADYKNEHGEEATGDALTKLENEAKIEAKI